MECKNKKMYYNDDDSEKCCGSGYPKGYYEMWGKAGNKKCGKKKDSQSGPEGYWGI